MCGRYLFAKRSDELYKRYGVASKDSPKLKSEPSYNIAPGSLVPVITRNSPNKIEIMKWGLIPHWAKDPKIGYKMINARSETINKKPSFREPFKNKRCLVPATGFYEWEKTDEGKMPYLIQLKTREIFSFAGIYDVWKDAEQKEFRTFSIITTSANELVKGVHDRMPVIFSKDDEDTWLDTEASSQVLLNILDPYDTNEMELYSTSQKVNNPKNQGKEVIERI